MQVETPKTTWRARHVIGADGVHSLVAKQSGLIPNRATSLAYEAHLSLPERMRARLVESITFDFGTILWGYGWIFPKHDHLNVGIFRSWPGRRASAHRLRRFIRQHPILTDCPLNQLRAYPVPLGGSPQPLHRGRILLVGDAANLADPWLGEGLYFALASGRMAAETLLKKEKKILPDLSAYTRLVNDILVRQLTFAKRLSFLVNMMPLFNVAFLSHSETLQQMIIDLFRGERSHQEIWQRIKGQFPILAIKILLGK